MATKDPIAINQNTVTVIINGQEQVFTKDELSGDGELSYDQIVGRAARILSVSPDARWTVLYSNGAGRPPNGGLDKGERVKVQDGTIFHATPTDDS